MFEMTVFCICVCGSQGHVLVLGIDSITFFKTVVQKVWEQNLFHFFITIIKF